MDILDEAFKKLKHLVKFYHFKFKVKEPQEDILQELILQLLSSNYMDRYDPSKPLHNYLSGFVYNYYCKVFKREGYSVPSAISLSAALDDTEDIVFEDLISENEVDLDSKMEIEHIFKLLYDKYSFSSFVVYNIELEVVGSFGKDQYDEYNSNDQYIVFVRSAATVFQMLYLGHTQAEIKDLLVVSKSWVSKIVKRIAALPEVQDFARSKGFSCLTINEE